MAKIIQVGLGRWGANWATMIVPSVATAEPVAYVDSAPAALERAQEEAGAKPSQCFGGLTEALDAVECDLVLATLRTEAHYAVVRQALEAGCNVVVEKPFASTIRQAKDLVALAAAQQRLLMVSQNYRYYPAPLLAAELIAGEALGPLGTVGIDFRYHAPTDGHAYPEMADPLLADMAIHHFDLMRLVLGDEPKRVSAVTWNPAGSPFSHDAAGIVTIQFGKGTLVSYRGSWVSGCPRTPWAGEWSMDCARGEIRWSSRDGLAPPGKSDVLTMRHYGQEAVAPVLPKLAYLDRAGALAAAIAAIETGELPPLFPTGADNLNSLALVAASILSASRKGDWVEIDEVLA
jgi:predicted dehydrogenase